MAFRERERRSRNVFSVQHAGDSEAVEYLFVCLCDDFAVIPDPPEHIHLRVDGTSLSMRWRYLQATGKPVLKFNVRVSDLVGRVLFEKVAYKPHVHFQGLPSAEGLRAEVNVMTAAGLSAWSQPAVFRPQGSVDRRG